MKKTIIWKGNEGLIPGAGMARPGKPISVDENLADSYISQGKATLPKPAKPKQED